MTARKPSRTNKPKPSRAQASDTPSRVRNSEVVGRHPDLARSDYTETRGAEPFASELGDEDMELARELERPSMPRRASTSGTLPAVADLDALPVVEPGMAIEPEEMGTQFLRDATENDNYESVALSDQEPGVVILPHVVISDATLDASMQEDNDWLESNATQHDAAEVPREPFERNLDLTQPTIGASSLFDQVVPDEELSEDELDDVPVEGVTVEPTLHTEDPSDPATFEEAREREMRRVRREMLKKRQQAEQAATPPRDEK